MTTLWPWYLSAAAVRQYAEIAGWPDTDEGFGRAEQELGALAIDARRTDARSKSGAEIWRSGRVRIGPRQRRARLEYTVMPDPRHEGDLPQLVRVRSKGAGGTGSGSQTTPVVTAALRRLGIDTLDGTALRAWRNARGLTQQQLGELLEYDGSSAQVMISRWERGIHDVPGWVALALDDLARGLR